jgi:thiol-disulfide isomerase/thioredoxin
MNALRLTRRLRPLAWAVAGLMLVVLVAWWAGAWSPLPEGGGDQRRSVAENVKPGVDIYPPDKRTQAPKLAGQTLDGAPFSLSDLAGQTVVINVWGSWCAPCRAETPDLVRLAGEYASRGVRFVGINTRDNPAAAKAFVRSFAVPYPSIDDSDGQVLLRLQGVIPTAVVPSTVVIDRHGRVAARIIGRIDYHTLKGLLADELAGGGT